MRGLTIALALVGATWAHAADTVPIPEGTRSITFDGQRLRIAAFEDLKAFVTPKLYVPRGRHLVRWNTGDSRVFVSSAHYAAEYRALRAQLAAKGDKGHAELLGRLARGYGFPDEASAPHLLGNWHWAAGDKEAAARWWKRAVLQNPAFAPSHLNLALAAVEAGERGVAVRELLLARAFTLGDGFGIDAAIDKLAAGATLELTGGTTLRASFYALAEREEEAPLDARMATFHRGMAAHFAKREDRAKLMSNLGLYLADKGKPVRAREAYRAALAELVRAGRSADGYAIAAVVFSNLSKACAASGWGGEAKDFERMAELAKGLR